MDEYPIPQALCRVEELENELDVVRQESAEDRLSWTAAQLKLEEKCAQLQEQLDKVRTSWTSFAPRVVTWSSRVRKTSTSDSILFHGELQGVLQQPRSSELLSWTCSVGRIWQQLSRNCISLAVSWIAQEQKSERDGSHSLPSTAWESGWEQALLQVSLLVGPKEGCPPLQKLHCRTSCRSVSIQ